MISINIVKKRYELIYNKRYQTFESVSSVLTTKVKGMGYIPIKMRLKKCGANCNSSRYFQELTSLRNDTNYKILDSTDYSILSNEHNSIFIMTNFIRTEQTRGICDEVAFLLYFSKKFNLFFEFILKRK
jgi:hypothetical protein